MKIIIDTNIWISFLLGKRLSFLREIFDNKDIKIYVSDILIKEIINVSNRPKFKNKINPLSIGLLLELIETRCKIINSCNNPDLPVRDRKDTFLLSMILNESIDFLITGDNDLLVLKEFHGTRIITFNEFNEYVTKRK